MMQLPTISYSMMVILLIQMSSCHPLPKRSISSDDETLFIRQNLLKKSTKVQLQSISSSITYKGVDYSLDDLEQFTILSDNFHPTKEERLDSPLWKKEVNGTNILVIKDKLGRIEHLSITQGNERMDMIALQNLNGNNTQINDKPWLYGTVLETDYDEEKINSMSKNKKDAFKYTTETSNQLSKVDNENIAALQDSNNVCRSFKIIDVAIAYDSTLCEKFNSDKVQADRHVQAVVGMASYFYEPMCMKLRISNIDGYCDPSSDPYFNMVRTETILERFTASWRSHRSSIKRDAAHLLTGNNFEKGVLGYAFKATLCTTSDAFGANYVAFSDNIALQASLFAHELGHNAGADHFGSECSNWLMAPCGNGLGGFSDESKAAVTKFINTLSCLASEAVTTTSSTIGISSNNNNINNANFQNIGPNNNYNHFANANNENFNQLGGVHFVNTNPTNQHFINYGNFPQNEFSNHDVVSVSTDPYNYPNYAIDPNAPSYFKIRSVAATRMCLTLRDEGSKTGEEDTMKVGLESCQNASSAKQIWKLNLETSYLHSASDESQCLLPDIENGGNNFSKKKRTRLIVKTCPYFAEDIFQWRFTADGLIMNRKRELDGTPMIMQASRGLKQKGNEDEVLFIPTLSQYPNIVNEFFRWSLIPV